MQGTSEPLSSAELETKTILFFLNTAGTFRWTADQDYWLLEVTANKACTLSKDPTQTPALFFDGALEIICSLTNTNLRLASMRHPLKQNEVIYFTTSAVVTQANLVLELVTPVVGIELA